MQDILKKHCIDDDSNGLLLIDIPTGSGKTFNVIEFIYNNFNHFDKKVFFITPLKKNLTYDKLKNKFYNDNRSEEFNEKVLYIKSNIDSLIDNFFNIYEHIPDKIKNDTITKHIRVLIDILNSKSSVDFKTEAQNNLREDWEPEFRAILENFVMYNESGDKRTFEERKNFIKNENKWINIIYPASLTDEAQVIFMTVNKFLSMNSTIIKPSYTIVSNDIINNSIIFIDEFDSAKENMLKNIIQNSFATKIRNICYTKFPVLKMKKVLKIYF